MMNSNQNEQEKVASKFVTCIAYTVVDRDGSRLKGPHNIYASISSVRVPTAAPNHLSVFSARSIRQCCLTCCDLEKSEEDAKGDCEPPTVERNM